MSQALTVWKKTGGRARRKMGVLKINLPESALFQQHRPALCTAGTELL